MSSILTNTSAMVALQTLKGINTNLAKTQGEISTGKSIASARDNSAIWAISTVMQSDVSGFKAISESLSLGSSTVAVARNASEQITELLNSVKAKVVAAQESNVDRDKIQVDINALRDQISSISGAAQFNGLNLLTGTDDVEILSSLDRAEDGSVTASNITVERHDLGTTATVVDAGGTYAAGSATVGAVSANLNATQTQTFAILGVAEGVAFSIGMTGTDADGSSFTPADYTTAATVAGATEISYVASAGDTAADVAAGLVTAYNRHAVANGLDKDVLSFSVDSSGGLVATSTVTDATDTLAVRVDSVAGTNVAGGGMEFLGSMDVTTDAGADLALNDIETLIQTAIDAAAEFGSVQGRIDIQGDFIGKLTDSLKAGIGALVDADMEEASARLQALQVQQQLGIQSLSIANQAPQNILSLFR